jgi:acetylornithine/N-succinyldiaminopimelate aminotransferase
MKNSFHGRTMGALAVTGQEKYQKDFLPLMEGVRSVVFNDRDDLTEKMDENVCGIIVEPIQGEGGIIPAQAEFLKKARELCGKYDALLIFDEVQCGIGRTGSLFAYRKFGVVPDVICMAKGLGGGFPIGGTLAAGKAAEALVPGDQGCTFGGNPLACAVSLAVLKELVDGGVIDGVDERAEYIKSRLILMSEKYDAIDGISGMGLLIGVRFKRGSKDVISKCFEKGLLLVGAGKDVVRILPPLNVKYEDIDRAMEIFEEAVSEI